MKNDLSEAREFQILKIYRKISLAVSLNYLYDRVFIKSFNVVLSETSRP